MTVDESRDPYGANAMNADQQAKHYAGLVAEAVAAGRRCEICPQAPTAIVLIFETEHLLCPEHAGKADRLHAQTVDFVGEERDLSRIIRWYPERDDLYRRRRQKHLS
ncbi:hypothetical protein [Actinoplanes sp. M2I2]|uniref:hypothetical protein n=1 Tax=Actinoplanes sp. M2I2 TaxID=1734444 RepID=UPI0020203187|nr:hypothetical protein [Actinoplanes sp. M2I2]